MILEIDENNIYYYHDFTFMIFNISAMIGGAEYIGYAWPAGKIPEVRQSENNVDKIKRDTCYHHMLLMDLIKSHKKLKIKGEIK